MAPIADFDFSDETPTVEIPLETLAQLVFGEGYAPAGPDRPTRNLRAPDPSAPDPRARQRIPVIEDVSIEHCSDCGVPAHASETDDLGRCTICARGEIVDYDIPGIATVETDVSDLSDGVPCGIEFEDTDLHVAQVAVG